MSQLQHYSILKDADNVAARLRDEIIELRAQVAHLRSVVVELKADVKHLTDSRDELRTLLAEQETKAVLYDQTIVILDNIIGNHDAMETSKKRKIDKLIGPN